MDWKNALEVVASIIAVVAAIYGVTHFIDWRIERKIHEESFLRRISSSLRPSAIFDENETILLDQGAMQFIERIEVKRKGPGSSLPNEIIITPNKYLGHAPLLQTLENELIDIRTKRGKGFEWCYELDYEMSNSAFDGKRRFRIEVLA